ncbi:hypothetical protein B0T19DRAFT_485715 [Cercophora scortea]|uniref:Uncharacterized protein n=1 Tax=Cercophora scortea TaxID=314031 RepID=A0AAE0IDY1_9PEZI|nr:hypothetical protein B0T19DRAFT_485715 [Cercophora scortea]
MSHRWLPLLPPPSGPLPPLPDDVEDPPSSLEQDETDRDTQKGQGRGCHWLQQICRDFHWFPVRDVVGPPANEPQARQIILQHRAKEGRPGRPLYLIYTAVSAESTEKDFNLLLNDAELINAKALAVQGGWARIARSQLDIATPTSIERFVKLVKKQHPRGIDLLVSTGPIASIYSDLNKGKPSLRGPEFYSKIILEESFSRNLVLMSIHQYQTPLLFMETAVKSLLKQRGRMVNVVWGVPNSFSINDIGCRWLPREAMTVDDVDIILRGYEEWCKITAPNWPENRSPVQVYSAALTKAVELIRDKEWRKGNRKLWVDTVEWTGKGPDLNERIFWWRSEPGDQGFDLLMNDDSEDD